MRARGFAGVLANPKNLTPQYQTQRAHSLPGYEAGGTAHCLFS